MKLFKYAKRREDKIFPSFFKKICFILIVALIALRSPASAATYTITNDIIGEVTHYTVTDEDTLYAIARRFDLGIVELMAANPNIDPWIPPAGTLLSIPSSYILPKENRTGIVINLSELRLYYFKDAKTVMTFPVGIGKDGWQTPVGETKIVLKRKNPFWTPPASIRANKPDLPQVIPAGPDNPLGQYAMNLGWPGFLIHGTNKPYGIGLRSSHGCIRMYPEDIEELFKVVKKDTKVTVIDTSYKIGWLNDILYLEVNPSQEKQAGLIFEDREPAANKDIDISKLNSDIEKIAGASIIDWAAVTAAIEKHTGLPYAIGVGAE